MMEEVSYATKCINLLAIRYRDYGQSIDIIVTADLTINDYHSKQSKSRLLSLYLIY